MIFFWQGLGFLGVVIPVAVALLTNFLLDAIFGHGFYSSHNYSILIAMTVSALIVWFVGEKLNNSEQDRILIDQETGEKVILKNKHTFFFISLKWWALGYIIFGLIGYFHKN